MKKKRNAMLLAILLIMVVLGGVYAAVLNQTLTINGYAHATTDASTFKVEFIPLDSTEANLTGPANAYFSEGTTNGNTATISDDHKTATFDVVFTKVRTSQSVIYKIKNSSTELSANVTVKTRTLNDDFDKYFSISDIKLSTDLEENGTVYRVAAPSDNIVLAAGETGYVEIPVQLDKEIAQDIGFDTENEVSKFNQQYSIRVELEAEPVEDSSN